MESRNMLAPGFRFHPTDEELVRYYLRRKVCGKPLRFDAISDIDIYKVEPWDLPGMSRLNTRDLEWYFFSMLDKKYGNGARTNRATEQGYWKTTGKDRAVQHKFQVVGMKKTLVYHSGRAPKGQRTNWVMHEYRLVDEELDKAGIPQVAFVLCRVFQKSGAGPKNGERYGAPFVEEEWENDELKMVPQEENAEEVEYGDDIYLDGYDLEQILGTQTPVGSASINMNCSDGQNCTNSEEANDCFEDAQKWLQQPDERKSLDPAVQDIADNPVKHNCVGESSKSVNSEYVNYLLNGPTNDASDDLQFNDGAFLEANDLSNPAEVDNSGFNMLDEYLTYFDANDDFQNLGFDPSVLIENDDRASLPEKKIVDVAQQDTAPIEGLAEPKNSISSSSIEKPTEFLADHQYRFMKQASQMLGSIPAPPAFASEFPTKGAALRLNCMSQSSSSVHVSAGLIQIRNMTVAGNGTDWSLRKHSYYNIILSFGLSRGSDNSATLESVASFPGKATFMVSRGLFFWVLVLSMIFKIGTLICAR
ncbi:NAC domain-containing protein 78-like [Lycium barbarum]|uniref:NAC domain-containing protein 78-like n=1 Tax=Lycium barbarum TaxID=112863 RepID=UPI00293E20F5|nr:NAC domain-containing protein 78-like [Lycium barbarum]